VAEGVNVGHSPRVITRQSSNAYRSRPSERDLEPGTPVSWPFASRDRGSVTSLPSFEGEVTWRLSSHTPAEIDEMLTFLAWTPLINSSPHSTAVRLTRSRPAEGMSEPDVAALFTSTRRNQAQASEMTCFAGPGLRHEVPAV